MSQLKRALPIPDAEAFKARCHEMLDWMGDIEMPEERVGLREAAGNICGMLVCLMTSQEAIYYREEAANVVALCGQLDGMAGEAERRLILSEIRACAQMASDGGTDLNVAYQ